MGGKDALTGQHASDMKTMLSAVKVQGKRGPRQEASTSRQPLIIAHGGLTPTSWIERAPYSAARVASHPAGGSQFSP